MPVRDLKQTFAALFRTGSSLEQGADPSLKCDRRTALSLPQKASGDPGMLLQASAPGHGGSHSLSKSFKWKRNVTGDFKANGFFHLVKHLKIVHQISAYVNVYVRIRTALTATEKGCFEKER